MNLLHYMHMFFNALSCRYILQTNHTTLNKILEPNVQFKIPIYQRTYDWDKKHCKQLYDDIVKVGNAKQEQFHFIGATTYVSETTTPDVGVSCYKVIDGQQRLTTLLLLLRALRESLDKSTEHVTEQKINQLLFNGTESKDGINYYKLMLTEDDDKILKDIMKDGNSESSNNITANFKYFISRLHEDGINPDIIWRGIRKLTIVEILIDEKDNAQAIFESMNSTGLDLSETDMIQNYLLMSGNSEWQKTIYREYWHPMEKRFGEEQNEHLEDFIRNYLTMHRGKIVSKREIYEYFKTHMINRDKEEEIKKMHKYSEYYANLIGIPQPPSNNPKEQKDLKYLKKVIKHIYSQDTNVANSLLLKLLADHADKIITEEECVQAFILIDSYLLRCHVCDMSKGGNKAFPEIIPKIIESDYVKSIEKALMSKAGNRKFPRDVTFRENLERLPLYMNRTMCKYMLVRLEHEKSKETSDPDNLTIEHVMPQTLTDEWKNELGRNWEDKHEKHLHTIGNLTLTAYNPVFGNMSFSYKRTGYEKSNVMLTREISEHTNWDDVKIKERTRLLSEQAVKLWKCPTGYDSEGKDQEFIRDNEAYEDEYLEGKNIELWNKMKEKIQSSCDGLIFRMTTLYGTFRLPTTASKSSVICSLEARRNKITIIYNTKLGDKILSPSGFVRDISNIGHFGSGHLSSTIMSEEDIGKAVNLVKIIYENKSINSQQ